MEPTKQQPFAKVVLLCAVLFGVLAAIFAGIITFTSHASFFVVFGWAMAFVVVLMIPTLFWGYVLEPKWWDKLSHQSQEKIRNWAVGLGMLVFIILIPAGMLGGDSWSGNGQVNLFPEGAVSKNYRLDADIEVKNGFLWRKTYTVNSVEWPDSGTSSFSDCTIGGSNYTCTDSEGRSWRIEVVQPPDAPDNSNN